MYRLQLVILNKIDNIDRHQRREDFFSQDSVKKNDLFNFGRMPPIHR
jgi:hypothetical protein